MGKKQADDYRAGWVTFRQRVDGFIKIGDSEHGYREKRFVLDIGSSIRELIEGYRGSGYYEYVEKYMPSGVELDSIDIRSSFSDMDISSVHSGSINIRSDSGSLRATKLTASSIHIDSSFGALRLFGIDTGMLEIISDSGDTTIEDMVSQGLSLKSSFGTVDIAGLLKGLSEIENDSGDVRLNLDNAKDSVSMEIYSDAGDIIVNGENKESDRYEIAS